MTCRLALAASLVALVAASPAAAGTIVMDHNGSAMTVAMDGRDLSISYLRPRAGLLKAGFEPGMVLLSATVQPGGHVVGQARAYSQKCGWAPYPIQGTVHTDAGIIELAGKFGGPTWDKGCSVLISPKSPHAELIFEASPADLASIDPDAARARTGAEMATILQAQPEAPASADVKAAPAWETRPAVLEAPAPEPQQAAAVEATPAPVAETVSRNETPPPAPVAAVVEQTPDQIEEAQAETELYQSPEFQAEIQPEPTAPAMTTPSPTPYVAPKAAAEAAPPPPAAPPAKKKLAVDF